MESPDYIDFMTALQKSEDHALQVSSSITTDMYILSKDFNPGSGKLKAYLEKKTAAGVVITTLSTASAKTFTSEEEADKFKKTLPPGWEVTKKF